MGVGDAIEREETKMVSTLKAALRRARERERLRREYLAILRLGPRLVRDVGLERSEIHARLDALNVPV